jgi:hypothetical protein
MRVPCSQVEPPDDEAGRGEQRRRFLNLETVASNVARQPGPPVEPITGRADAPESSPGTHTQPTRRRVLAASEFEEPGSPNLARLPLSRSAEDRKRPRDPSPESSQPTKGQSRRKGRMSEPRHRLPHPVSLPRVRLSTTPSVPPTLPRRRSQPARSHLHRPQHARAGSSFLPSSNQPHHRASLLPSFL